MKKRSIKVLPQAEKDLTQIRDYLLKNTSLENTERVLTGAWQTISCLEDMAAVFPVIDRDGLAPGVRGVRIQTGAGTTQRGKKTRWVVFYRIVGQVVEVLGVRHTSQRPLWEK